MEIEKLPQNWVVTSVGVIYDVIGGGTPSTSIDDYWKGTIPWITSADIHGVRDIEISRYVSEQGIKNSATNKIPPKTLLVVTRVGLGKIAIAEREMCFSQDLQGLVQAPDVVWPEYALYYLSYELQNLKYEGRGTTISGITKKQLKDVQFPLPPLNEQKRIVAKIEELFSVLDKGIESLKTAREQLRVYRQAVLKQAFEGKLTARWREENRDKLETAEQLRERIKHERDNWLAVEVGKGNNEAKRLLNKQRKFTFDKPEKNLPYGWEWISFTEALQVVVDCHNKTAPYEDRGIYLIRTSNIREGKLDLNNDIRFVSESTYKFWSRRCFPESGDILFSREAPMGEAAIIPHNTKVCMGQRIMLLRSFNQLLNAKYLLYSVLSPEFQSMMMKSAIGTGVKHLRVGDVEKLAFPICSPLEQDEIVRYLDRKFSSIEMIEQDIEQNLQKSEALRQSILKKAFCGKLVAQDPNDEPASVLLERIRAEKRGAKNGNQVVQTTMEDWLMYSS